MSAISIWCAVNEDPRRPRFTKANLPSKTCLACGRPFDWRKKWRATWDEVKTCSDRCKGELRRAARAN